MDRINRISGLRSFLSDWDEPHALGNKIELRLCRTVHGNIASTDIAGSYSGNTFSRWQPQFEGSLEPGVKDLVLLLVRRFGWITYTSCEGHQYRGTALVPVGRHVGLLPRTSAETGAMERTLERAAARGRRSAAYVAIRRTALESDSAMLSTVDLCFLRDASATVDDYFSAVDSVYEALLSELSGTGAP